MVDENIVPDRYKATGADIDVIDAVKLFRLNFNLGNVFKYITRHEHKGTPIQDLKKAREYLDREIKYLEKDE
jgi:hypothetical protein